MFSWFKQMNAVLEGLGSIPATAIGFLYGASQIFNLNSCR